MAQIIESAYGQVHIAPGFRDDGTHTGRNLMSFQTEAVINFFRDFTVIKGDIVRNEFGLYSYGSIGRNKKMRFGKFKGNNHLWQKRLNGCTWNPKGSYSHDITEVVTSPMEAQTEICPDALWESCWEKLMGTGNKKRDLYGTEEVSELMGIILDRVFNDLGDGFYDVAWFGKHPLIERADEEQTYSTSSEEEWMDYKDQQDIHPGFLTYVDHYKYKEGLAHFNVPINNSEVNGPKFVGDPTELFDRLYESATYNFKVANDAGTVYGAPLILVSGSIFQAYEDYLVETHGDLPEMFYYRFNGEFCERLGCIGNQVPGVLRYKGRPVIRMSEWDRWAHMLGVTQHRAMMVPPGIFGLGWDVDSLDQYSGMGLILDQKLSAPDLGKIYMHTMMEMATALVDTDFITSASIILE
ncbi:MAG TPA: hypothetical protein VK031_04745 [Tissierellaceae bacterium]|nr:hypothetical protein [Tissierellaceae bacterium]